MNEQREDAACTVFEGKIVVSGGCNGNHLNTVEAYDHVVDKWTYMPNMIEERRCHSLAAVKHKLFVFGFRSSEVYDSTLKKFVSLKERPSSLSYDWENFYNLLSIGSKLVRFGYWSNTALYYDVEMNEWSEESFKVNKDRHSFGCTVVPQVKL